MAKKNSPSSAASASFTDTKRVKDLIALMAENDLTEIELVEDKSRIVLRRGTGSGGGGGSVAASHFSQPSHVHHPSPSTSSGGSVAPAAKVEEDLIPIKSPMVGTFYSSPNPESDAFVSIGTEVTKDKTVVCIIEAMKVFNEIHADATGTVVKVLVVNGQALEYGQPMFLVKAPEVQAPVWVEILLTTESQRAQRTHRDGGGVLDLSFLEFSLCGLCDLCDSVVQSLSRAECFNEF